MNSPLAAFEGNAPAHQSGGWRSLERVLVDLSTSHKVHIIGTGGVSYIEVVVYQGAEETVTIPISLEALAKFLAAELGL